MDKESAANHLQTNQYNQHVWFNNMTRFPKRFDKLVSYPDSIDVSAHYWINASVDFQLNSTAKVQDIEGKKLNEISKK